MLQYVDRRMTWEIPLALIDEGAVRSLLLVDFSFCREDASGQVAWNSLAL